MPDPKPFRSGTAGLSPGDSFDPKNAFICISIPVGLAQRSDVSDGAQKLYGRLMAMRNTQTGQCNASVETLAKWFGRHPRTIKVWLAELSWEPGTKDVPFLIRRDRTGGSAQTIFLWHPCLEASVKPDQQVLATNQAPQKPKRPRREVQKTAPRDAAKCNNLPLTGAKNSTSQVQKTALAYKEEASSLEANISEASKQASEYSEPPLVSVEPACLPAPLSKISNPENPNSEELAVLTSAFRTAGIIANLEDLPLILKQGKNLEARPAVIGLFISDKAAEKRRKEKPIESSRFFLRSIPEDMAGWIEANSDRIAELTKPAPPPPCSKCNDTGAVGLRKGESLNASTFLDDKGFLTEPSYAASHPVRCECEAGERHRVQFAPIKPCSRCRCELGYRDKAGSSLICVKCIPPNALQASQDEITQALTDGNLFPGIPRLEQDCRDCRREGIIYEERCTPNVTVRFCRCAFGACERRVRGDVWLEQTTASLREAERESAEFDAKFAAKAPGIRPKVKASTLAPAAPIPEPPVRLTQHDLDRIKRGDPEHEVMRDAMARRPAGSSQPENKQAVA